MWNCMFVTDGVRCTKEGCTAKLHSHIARKAHEKKHAGWSISFLVGGPFYLASMMNSLIRNWAVGALCCDLFPFM